MKKIHIILLASLVFLGACTSPEQNKDADQDNSASVLQTILERGTIRVGTTGDFNPMSFKDPATNTYIGHDIELVEKLAADMGVEIEWVATDWKNLVTGIVAGKYDITTGASYNAGRAKTAGYTLPVVAVGTVPLVRKSEAARFDSWESINSESVTVATTLGTVFEEQVKNLFPEAIKKSVEAPARDFQEVLAGRADVSITSNIEAAVLTGTYPELTIAAVDGLKYSNAIGLLAPQNDQVFINFLNVWITMQERSGFLADLEKRWLGAK